MSTLFRVFIYPLFSLNGDLAETIHCWSSEIISKHNIAGILAWTCTTIIYHETASWTLTVSVFRAPCERFRAIAKHFLHLRVRAAVYSPNYTLYLVFSSTPHESGLLPEWAFDWDNPRQELGDPLSQFLRKSRIRVFGIESLPSVRRTPEPSGADSQ